MGNNQGAVGHFKDAVSLNPGSVQSNFYLGLTLMEVERYVEACEVFETVVQVKPDFADVHFMLGNLYTEKIKDSDKAISHLKKAEKLFIKLDDNLHLSHVRQILIRHHV